MRRILLFSISLALAFFGTRRSAAQDLVYQVYQVETPYQGHVVLKSHNAYIVKSNLDNEHFGKSIPNLHAFGQSFEAEIGVLDHLELSLYADFEKPTAGNFAFTQSHFSLMYRIGERFDHWVNMALYAEYYVPRKSFSSSQEAELRLILDKDFGDVRVALNPSLSRYVGGDESKKLAPGINGGIYLRRAFVVQPGVEYYANINESKHVIFPTLDLHFSPGIMLNVGAGFGLTPSSDKMLFKSNLAFDIEAIRPARLFRKPYHNS